MSNEQLIIARKIIKGIRADGGEIWIKKDGWIEFELETIADFKKRLGWVHKVTKEKFDNEIWQKAIRSLQS